MFSNRQKMWFAIFINIIFPLAGVSTDIYLPSLPAMASDFVVSKAVLQFTVTTYVVAMAIGQLLAGPISDAYGRKKPMFIAIVMQLVACLGILLTHSIYVILALRFLQGIGAALMMVPARAIINDIFTGEQLKKQFGYSTISFALAPIVAPYIGGYLQVYFGWRSNFIFIFIYEWVVLLLLFIMYAETAPSRKVFNIKQFYQNYASIIVNKKFMRGTLFVSTLMGYFSLFSIVGPFIIQDTLHKTPIYYGRVALLMGIAWFLGNLCNRIFFRIGEHERTMVSLVMITLSSIALLLCSWLIPLTVSYVTICLFLMIMFSGFIFPIYVAESLMVFKELAASANACLFSFTWLFYGVYTIIGAMLKASSAMPMALVCMIISMICIYIYRKIYINFSL